MLYTLAISTYTLLNWPGNIILSIGNNKFTNVFRWLPTKVGT